MTEGDTAPRIENRVKIGNRSYRKKTGEVIGATQYNVTPTNTLKRIKWVVVFHESNHNNIKLP